MRRAAKRDENEPEIAGVFLRRGWGVISVSDEGFPDLVCLRRGVVLFIEVKKPETEADQLNKKSGRLVKSKAGKLTKKQEKVFAIFEANEVHVHVVQYVDEAVALATKYQQEAAR